MHYVYKIIQLSTRKEYIGIHSTDDFNDGYMGSGTLIKPAVDACPDDFVKTIVWMCKSRQEAEELESTLVTEEYLEENFPERTYNQVPGGKASFEMIRKWQKKLYPTKSRVGRGANAGKIKVTDGTRNMWIFPCDFDEKIHSRNCIKPTDGKIKVTDGTKNFWIKPEDFDEKIHSRELIIVTGTGTRSKNPELQILPSKIVHAFKLWKYRNKARGTLSIEKYNRWEQRVLSKNPGIDTGQFNSSP